MNQVVNSHNNSPSQRNPKLTDGTHASPKEVIEDPETSAIWRSYLDKEDKINIPQMFEKKSYLKNQNIKSVIWFVT